MTPLITLEEHWISRKAVTASNATEIYTQFPPHIVAKLEDVGSGRVSEMDKGNVTLQVLSHGPLELSSSTCIDTNNELAEAISKNPTRLAALAMLAMGEPENAAQELERCVKEHKFLGALIDNHLDGEFYDDEKFWPVFQKAEELDVPIYIHPTFASEEMMKHYKGNYDDRVAGALSAFGWGWHSDTGLHFLRLFASGLFDRYPKLKIVIGHMGELLPFQLGRIIPQSARWAKHARGLEEVWKTNIWVTTSGMFTLPPLTCLLQTQSIEHVLYSVDYPFSANETGLKFAEDIKKSGLMTEEQFEMFAYKNAEKLLKVKAQT